MSNCAKHKKEVAGISDMKELADLIGDLHYETLAWFLEKLADKISLDGIKDEAAGREKLAGELYMVAGYLAKASYHCNWVWEISKPFMKNNEGKKCKHSVTTLNHQTGDTDCPECGKVWTKEQWQSEVESWKN